MPDSLPVISRSPKDSRIAYAFGHGHIGLTLAGITGRLVCDLISGQTPAIDLHPLRADRFWRAGPTLNSIGSNRRTERLIKQEK
jgi:D-amino-acid dehydrogenase